MTLIHATFADGSTQLFDPSERVWVASMLWWDNDGTGEQDGVYPHEPQKDYAHTAIKPDRYVFQMDHCSCPRLAESRAKIIRIREVLF